MTQRPERNYSVRVEWRSRGDTVTSLFLLCTRVRPDNFAMLERWLRAWPNLTYWIMYVQDMNSALRWEYNPIGTDLSGLAKAAAAERLTPAITCASIYKERCALHVCSALCCCACCACPNGPLR